MAQREVDEAMRKVRQASHSITNVIEPGEEREGREERGGGGEKRQKPNIHYALPLYVHGLK